MGQFVHAAVHVRDLDRIVDFYGDAFDLEKTGEFESPDGARQAFVGGDGGGEIQFKEIPDRGDPVGIDHLAIEVEDLDDRLDSLAEAWGIEADRGPLEVPDGSVRVAFVTDPEGYAVELVEPYE